MDKIQALSYDIARYMIHEYPKDEDIRAAREFIEEKINKAFPGCEGCVYLIGRHCTLPSGNNCSRDASDYYMTPEDWEKYLEMRPEREEE